MTKERLCPRCFLPMNAEDVMNSVSLKDQTVICSLCGQIESLDALAPGASYGVTLGQRQVQAAKWDINKKHDPNLPKIEAGSQQLWYDTETKVFTLLNTAKQEGTS